MVSHRSLPRESRAKLSLPPNAVRCERFFCEGIFVNGHDFLPQTLPYIQPALGGDEGYPLTGVIVRCNSRFQGGVMST